MTKAIAIQQDGANILVELAELPEIVSTSTEGTAGLEDIAEKLDQVAGTVVKVCTSLHTKAYAALGTMQPSSFELEFGVTLAGEAGVPLVTKGTAQCAFKVIAKWEGTKVSEKAKSQKGS